MNWKGYVMAAETYLLTEMVYAGDPDPKVESPSSRSATYVSSHQAAERLNNLVRAICHSGTVDSMSLGLDYAIVMNALINDRSWK